MSVHLDAIEALIPSGIGCFRTEAPNPLPEAPYVVIIAPEFMRRALTMGGEQPIGDYFQVMYVAESDEQLRDMVADVRDALDRAYVRPAGWHGRITLRASQAPPSVDRSVKLPGAGHPIYCTDLMRYDAAPTGDSDS